MLVDIILSLLLLLLILAAMTGVYLAGAYLAARRSGWHRLAAEYPRPRALPTGNLARAEKARVGGVTYKNIVYYATRDEGLELTCDFLDRLAHPPLLVPWSGVIDHDVRSAESMLMAALAPKAPWHEQLLVRLGWSEIASGAGASPHVAVVRLTVDAPTEPVRVELVVDAPKLTGYLNTA